MCGIVFTKGHVYYRRHAHKMGRDYQPACSKQCVGRLKSQSHQVRCDNCGTVFEKTQAQCRKSLRGHFCSRSCSAIYNNRHKQHGTRRSSLECYLEQQIRTLFADIRVVCNSSVRIGLELDFYFPELAFAIEVNGLLHYQAVYGEEKLHDILRKDEQKQRLCEQQDIHLHVINASTFSHLTKTEQHKYRDILVSLLTEKVGHRPPEDRWPAPELSLNNLPGAGLEPA